MFTRCETQTLNEHVKQKDSAASGANASLHWPIYILSLEGEEERREPLRSALSDMGLSSEVLIGVNGRNGLPHWAEEKILRTRVDPAARPLTDGEYACALSHVNAYHKILDGNIPGAIIFEDDARIDDGFKKFVDARGYAAGDIVLLGHRGCWGRRFHKREISPGLHLHRVAITPHLAHAYSISFDGARVLLEYATPVREPADWPCNLSRMIVFALAQQVAHQKTQDLDHSHLEADRLELLAQHKRVKFDKKWKRFLAKRFSRSWWRTWFVRRISIKLS